MNIKSLLLGSAAALVAVSGAQAADAIVAPEPEAVEYVRVCDAYGAGYFYIPGTETCLRIGGYVRADIKGGDNVYARANDRAVRDAVANKDFIGDLTNKKRDTYNFMSRFALRFTTASETELGTLKTYADLRFQYENGKDAGSSGSLRYGYIQLGGLRVGLDESAFVTFPGYYGDVMNDDVILGGGYRTNAISYTFTGGNGFSAMIALEQGGTGDADAGATYVGFDNKDFKTKGVKIDDYTPHIVGGLKFEQAWGSIVGVAAYDAQNEEWAGKVRLDVNVTEQFSVWVQGGYKSNNDHYAYAYTVDGVQRGVRIVDSFYGTWGGDWAVWGGAKFKATDKATFNVQLAYEDAKTFAATANVAYQLVPGFTITPEVSYTKWSDNKSVLKGDDAWQGMIRFQRSF
ncbi:porin [Pseudochrobactrum asaccharolyticum]|uniref:Porin n=2 Tax=Pseudochrobactrum TaxID=354349 RepID=A0A366E8Q8_9HYPH|nr:porin [Pseudochrobactrum asaccharolyticum]RBO98756.1 porin-like protein [Pseudochrobactrum asaccharolyticum]